MKSCNTTKPKASTLNLNPHLLTIVPINTEQSMSLSEAGSFGI